MFNELITIDYSTGSVNRSPSGWNDIIMLGNLNLCGGMKSTRNGR